MNFIHHRNIRLIAALLVISTCFSCQKEYSIDDNEGTFPLTLHFKNVVDNDSLILDTEDYTSPFGEIYRVTMFRYYISHITLINTTTGDSSEGAETYFLVDAAIPASGAVTARFKTGRYNKIQFLIGVDSARNVSGAQTGALGVEHGMFWDWNTGYVFAKLEGVSPVVINAGNKFTYHIGGFESPFSALKQVSLTIPGGEEIEVGAQTEALSIKANVNSWFKGVHDFPLGTSLSGVHSVGEVALRYASNYALMFSMEGVL